MKLRAHHLLCVRFYCGHGYSEAFNARMKEVIAALEAGTPFTLTDGPDDLCEACPNLLATPSGTRCRTQEKVSRYDERTADALGLTPGDRLRFESVKALTDERVFRVPGTFEAICGDCEWRVYCRPDKA